MSTDRSKPSDLRWGGDIDVGVEEHLKPNHSLSASPAGTALISISISRKVSLAVESIKRYKLNDREPLREARQKLWKKCRDLIDQAFEVLQVDLPTVSSQGKLRSAFKSLQEMLSPEEPFSAVAHECLNASGHRWAQRIAGA
jgi:hypothetical protein